MLPSSTTEEDQMLTATTTSYDGPVASTAQRHGLLRRMLAGAAAFDGAMGVACLAAGSQIGGWLSIGARPVEVTGVVFLIAAVAGVATLRRPVLDVHWIAGANLLFAAWCLAEIGFAGPSAIGVALLAVGAATSAATAVAEYRLA
jgi:hypothetical protein